MIAAAEDLAPFTGFSSRAAERENATELRYRVLVSTDQISKFHRYLTSEPHPAGSPRNNQLAQWIAEQWRQQGLEDVTIHQYDVLNSSPRDVSLEMVAPKKYRAILREAAYEVDPDTKNPDVSGAYLGYSASGEVTAPLVYAHSGNPEDYAYLRKHGIDVRGKIALVRYSNPYSYRGFKALTAERLGVAALLIYSDPAEDGFKRGTVYPDGPWGPESHIQRGAITYDFLEPGDPLTPGWASVPGAKRIPAEQAVSLPKIMALPLSWHDAEPLLRNLDGAVAPDEWQGGLPLKYRLGGKRVRVHVKVDMNTNIEPYYVSEARIRGSESPDEWVILGNHRDAWVFGAVDPSSGTASMLELTRESRPASEAGNSTQAHFGDMQLGWRGVCAHGLHGMGRAVCRRTQEKSGRLPQRGRSHLRERFPGRCRRLARAAPCRSFPDSPGAVGTRCCTTSGKPLANTSFTSAEPVLDSELANTRIGSGSDHTVFLNFLGIPTVGLTFVGPYGVYHSMYDDFYWMNHFGDPGYRYHALMAQLWGVMALRLANADILPFDFASYGANIRKFISSLDAATHLGAKIDLVPLQDRAAEFEAAGRELNESVSRAISSGRLNTVEADRVNDELMQVERNWCNSGRNSGPSMVEAHFIWRSLYLRSSRTARTHGSCRGGGLGPCSRTGENIWSPRL